MIVEVDAASHTPVYEQIREQVTRMVAGGVLAPGARLPAIRQLAGDLGLAKGTVARAYEALLRDGVVRAAGRHGTVVADRAGQPATREVEHALQQAARAYAVTVRQLRISPRKALREAREALEALEQLPTEASEAAASHRDQP